MWTRHKPILKSLSLKGTHITFRLIPLTETSHVATLEKRVPEKCTQRVYFLSEKLLWRRNIKFGGLLAISAISHNVKCFYILSGICLFFFLSLRACIYVCELTIDVLGPPFTWATYIFSSISVNSLYLLTLIFSHAFKNCVPQFIIFLIIFVIVFDL